MKIEVPRVPYRFVQRASQSITSVGNACTFNATGTKVTSFAKNFGSVPLTITQRLKIIAGAYVQCIDDTNSTFLTCMGLALAVQSAGGSALKVFPGYYTSDLLGVQSGAIAVAQADEMLEGTDFQELGIISPISWTILADVLNKDTAANHNVDFVSRVLFEIWDSSP